MIRKSELLAASAALALCLAWLPAAAKDKMSNLDTDKDGSVTMDEAHASAGKKFDKLDAKHTGKVSKKRIPAIAKAMDEMKVTDQNAEIDKTQYMAGVDAAFKEADHDNEGKLTPDELKTPAGKKFLNMVE